MAQELTDVIFQVSRWFFAFLGVLAVLSAFGWLHAEKKARSICLRSLPAAGTVGELMVLAGSDELPVQTWFPVCREGVLGSVRSCDLVVPCPGVKAHHLDFYWKDGIGLIIRPRSGCEVLVDRFPLDCRSDVISHPLTHGGCLQVGEAVLRLQVLKALDLTYHSRVEETEEINSAVMPPVDPASLPYDSVPYEQGPGMPVWYGPVPYNSNPVPEQAAVPEYMCVPTEIKPEPSAPVQPVQPSPIRRGDRWKEDWSE